MRTPFILTLAFLDWYDYWWVEGWDKPIYTDACEKIDRRRRESDEPIPSMFD